MTDQDMIVAIVNAIQTDSNLITLLRATVSNNISNVPSAQLQAIMTLLGLPTS